MNRRPMPPVWVINLKRSVDRRTSIRAQLDRLGLDYELVEGVDGRELSPEQLASWYSPSAALALFGRELATGEVGCSLSHLRLYQRQLDEGHEEVVILEDDVVVDPVFLEVMAGRDALPADWELILFHRLNSPQVSFWGSRRFDRLHRCVRFASIADGTQSYLLRHSGARKLLAHGYPVRVTADGLTGGALNTGVRLYGLDPPCIREWASDPTLSTMPESHAVRPRWPTREELGPVGWVLHKSKWGLIRAFRRINPFSIV